MLDVNKLAKGDRIIYSEGGVKRKYLVADLSYLPKWVYVRGIHEDGSQDSFQYAWYVDRMETDKMEKVYEWCDWRKYTCPDGGIAKYKTNRRDIVFKRDGIEVSTSCHDDDIFDLNYGLGLCWDRWSKSQNVSADSASSTKVAPKKINMNELQGQKFGDYVAIKIAGKDKSRHNIWECICPICGDTIYATAYDLMHGRKNTVCNKCKDKKEKSESSQISSKYSQISSKDYETTVHIGDPYPCGSDSTTSKAITTTSTTWYSDGSIVTTCSDFADDTTTTKVTNTAIAKDYPDFVALGDYINYREIKKDLLDYPVYYKIAHCIPADLTFYGDTAKRIDKLFNLSYIFKANGYEDSCDVGEVIFESNVFTLLPNKKKFAPVEDKDLEYCLNDLAFLCARERIKYLAMPRICCGSNKKDWNTVKTMILEAFNDVYTKASETANTNEELPEEIYIDFCYQ